MREYNLFISHSWTYSNQYYNIERLLRKHPNFRFKNYSVPKDDPISNAPTQAKLREAIRNQMASCSVVVVLAGVYATHSKWIDEEIFMAKKRFVPPKPLLAVEPFASQKTSLKVKAAADRIVGWNTNSIVSAIRDLAP